MRHARDCDLDLIEPLLIELRRRAGMTERKRGVFYRGSKAFLHFHEDAGAIYADVRTGDEFERIAIASEAGHSTLLGAIDTALSRR
ncbi:MAG: hypothetical protein JO218_17110 [Burkholderiales bacterium]|nr:hypothetical protein [Burkholderiales bacterium]